jgi:hypothetical protein
MAIFNGGINALLRGLAAAFAWAPPVVSLTVLSIVVGVAMLWVFRRTSDQARIRAVKRNVYACLLELRVYADEPAITWRAQKALLRANLRYLLLALRPALWVALPLALLLIHLEPFYGRAPLPLGRDAIVTAAFSGPLGETSPELFPPAGVEISAPPVRVLDQRQVSWRIRPTTAVSANLRLRIRGEELSKTIDAGGEPRFIAGRRVSSALAALWHPDEPPIGSSAVSWIDVPYPEAHLAVFGLRIHWLLWFVIISMLAALMLKKWFGVTF